MRRAGLVSLLSFMASNEVSNVFYSEGASEEAYAKSRDELSHFLDNCTIIDPGILCFCFSAEFLPEHGSLLVMAIPCINHNEAGRHDAQTAVWIDNRWKLLLWNP